MGALNKDLCDKEGGKTGIKFYAGDVLYGKLRPYLMNWLYPQFNGVAVGDFWVLRATECDSSFLYRLVQTDSFQKLANVSSGSKMPRADWNLISQSFFAVPADHAEQKAIAKSLAELDSLITLHQRKCQYRSLCGYHSWEQRKLGDVGTFRRGERFTADDYAEDGIPCIHYGEIYTSYVARAEETFSHLRPELAGSLRYAHPGELVIACTSENVEDVCKAVAWCGSCDVAIHDDSFAFSHSGDPDFFSALTQSPAFYDQKARAAHGVKVMRVSSEALEKMDVAVPSRDEQKQIGSVFRNLDSLITLHQ